MIRPVALHGCRATAAAVAVVMVRGLTARLVAR
jgi:hypothetical protein